SLLRKRIPHGQFAFPVRTVPLPLRAHALPSPVKGRGNSRLIASRLLRRRDPPPAPEIRCARDQPLRVFHHGASQPPANLLPSLRALNSAHLPDLDLGKFRSDAKTGAHWHKARAASVARETRENARPWQCLVRQQASPTPTAAAPCRR